MPKKEKNIRFSQHGQDRMQERGVPHEHVIQTIRHPDTVGKATSPNAKRYERRFSRHQKVVVIAEEKESEIRVVSVWKGRLT